MKNNRFYVNRKAIDKLATERGVDLDTASRMYAHEHGWTGWQGEMDEWKAMVRKYEQAKDKPTKATEHMDKNKDGHINADDLFE